MNIRMALPAAALALGFAGSAAAQDAKLYPSMAPLKDYQIASRDAEIALARSAAPPSISNDAEILVLSAHGHDVAVKGKNGFVCIVERGWANDIDNAEFWSPKTRSPTCFNPAAARSVLPTYLKRTEWVLAGVSRDEIDKRTKAGIANKTIKPPEVGSMCYMMSKEAHLNDEGGHWHPHLMYYLPRTDPAQWGANMKGSPVIGTIGGSEPLTIFMATVTTWSDGTPAMAM